MLKLKFKHISEVIALAVECVESKVVCEPNNIQHIDVVKVEVHRGFRFSPDIKDVLKTIIDISIQHGEMRDKPVEIAGVIESIVTSCYTSTVPETMMKTSCTTVEESGLFIVHLEIVQILKDKLDEGTVFDISDIEGIIIPYEKMAQNVLMRALINANELFCCFQDGWKQGQSFDEEIRESMVQSMNTIRILGSMVGMNLFHSIEVEEAVGLREQENSTMEKTGTDLVETETPLEPSS